MPLSKRIRFEVFKRDGFICSYCGSSPPRVILEVDHIEPKSKNGSDDINNLITACFDCNRGKSNISLKKTSPQIKENLELIKEKEDQIKEYRKYIKKVELRINKDIKDIEDIFSSFYPNRVFTEQFKQTAIKKFLTLLPKHEIISALHLAISKMQNENKALKYFCGICWHIIKDKGSMPQ